MIVVDASAVGPIVFADEAHLLPASAAERLLTGALIVPMHWHLEVANMVEAAVRRRRLTLEQASHVLRTLSVDPQVDLETSRRAWRYIVPLARRHQLTVYDAAYLELAIRSEGSLASNDADLVAAARLEGVPLIYQDA